METMSCREVAAYLGYSYFYFMREIKTDASFPKPIRRKTMHGLGHAKYEKTDIERYKQGLKAAA